MEYHLVSNEFVKHFGPCNMSKPLNHHGREIIRVVQLSFNNIENWANKKLENNPDFLEDNNIWTREITSSYLSVENFELKKVQKLEYTIFEWIMDEFDLSQPRNVAAIIGNVCHQENLTPIELFNKLSR